MATKLAPVRRHALTSPNSVVFLNDGARRAELVDQCVTVGWQVCDAQPELPCEPAEPTRRIIEFLARPDSPHRCALIGYSQMGLAALSVASRQPERVTAVIAIDVPFDGAVRSDAAKLSCPVMIWPEDDPGDIVAAVGWFLSKHAAPADQGTPAAQRDFRF